jgi:endonuclease-3
VEPGTYTLLVVLEEPTVVEFGAAGSRDLRAGWYAYTGSAFGPGGLKRVDRHRSVSDGYNGTRQWHIDYLLGAETSSIVGTWTAPGRDAECAIARSLSGEPIHGLGATDCDCRSHLRYSSSRDTIANSIESTYP